MVSYPGAVSIQQNIGSNQEAVHFRISNSIFYYNQSPIVSTVVKNYTNFIDRGFGGAMFIEFGGGTSHSSLIIEDSRFTYNTAARGGAIYAYYTNSAWNNSIRIFNTEFKGNSADISGGGLNLGCTSAMKNVFEVAHSNFISNFALYGAGLTMFSAFGNSELVSTDFTISNSTWWNNSGILSSAVDIGSLVYHVGEKGYLPTPKFVDCTFDSNTIRDSDAIRDRRRFKTNHKNIGVFSVTQLAFGKLRWKHNF